jgi:hypothetical protein
MVIDLPITGKTNYVEGTLAHPHGLGTATIEMRGRPAVGLPRVRGVDVQRH